MKQLQLPMPKPGETITEAMIVNWLSKAGDVVKEGQGLFEMETEKAVFEYESPLSGTIKNILVSGGQKVKVGTPIAMIEVDDEAATRYISMGVAMLADGTAQFVGAGSPRPQASAKIDHVETPSDTFVFATPDPVVAKASVTVLPTIIAKPSSGGPSLSPYLRKLAREKNLSQEDLANIKGSGPDGRIAEADILNYQAKPQVAIAPAMSADEARITAIRARIAENLSKSKREIPHAGASVEIDVNQLYETRKSKVDAWLAKYNAKLTLFTPFAYAVVQVLKADPYLNSVYLGEGRTNILEKINLGISVSTDRGLMVPVLKDAGSLNFVDFWMKSNDLVERARIGKLKPDELSGNSFTINNPGALGSDKILQIIPPNTVAILGFNRVAQKPAIVGGQIVARWLTSADVQFDHRAADGKEAIRFLVALKKYIEQMDLNETLMA